MKSSTWWVFAVVLGSQALMWGVGAATDHIAASTPSGSPAAIVTNQDAPRMTIGQLVQRQKAAQAPIVLDLRQSGEYEAGHIAGAVNIPFELLGKWAADMQPELKKRPVVLYCACVREHSAAVGVRLLTNQGFAETWALQGGWQAWQQAGYPVRTGKKP